MLRYFCYGVIGTLIIFGCVMLAVAAPVSAGLLAGFLSVVGGAALVLLPGALLVYLGVWIFGKHKDE